MEDVRILKVYKVVHKRHKNQSFMFKQLHKARMYFCKHSVEPIAQNEYQYMMGHYYGECTICEALCKLNHH